MAVTGCCSYVPSDVGINSTSGVPWTLVMGYLPTSPLSILRDSWCGDENLPVSFGKKATEYYHDYLRENWKSRKRMLFHMQGEKNEISRPTLHDVHVIF